MFLVTFDFQRTYLKQWCYASGVYKCKSCEIRNQIFFNAMLSFSKTKEELVMTNSTKQNCLVVPFCMVSLWTYLEPGQTFMSDVNRRCLTWFQICL